jgi:hypothetical protein
MLACLPYEWSWPLAVKARSLSKRTLLFFQISAPHFAQSKCPFSLSFCSLPSLNVSMAGPSRFMWLTMLVINWKCIREEWCQNFSPAGCIGAGTSWSTTPKVHWKCWVWYYLHKGTSFSKFSTPSLVLFMFHHVIMWCLSMVLGHCYQQKNLLCNKPLPQDCLWMYPLAF